MTEIWKDIEGYEGWYEVSSYGRVRSVDRVVTYFNGIRHLLKGRIMNLPKDKDGYLLCNLSKNGKATMYRVHRLVAQTFIPNPDGLSIINHKDENPSNNHVSNLEWCTQTYNVNYGTGRQRSVEKHSKPVLQLDLVTEQVIGEFPSISEASRQLKVNLTNISRCCRGKYKSTGGFKWKYK